MLYFNGLSIHTLIATAVQCASIVSRISFCQSFLPSASSITQSWYPALILVSLLTDYRKVGLQKVIIKKI